MDTTPTITTVWSIGGQSFIPDDFTCLVGLKPTKIWRQKSELLNAANADLAKVGWQYKLDKQRKWNIGEAIEELVDMFWSKRDEINAFVAANRLRIEIRCIPFGDASTIEYIIGPEVMAKLAYLGISLSLAVYDNDSSRRRERGHS